MFENSFLAFKSYAAMLSVYEALPHRPLVLHVSAELLMGDACLAFFDSAASTSSPTPTIVEVMHTKQPNAHLTYFDLLSYLSMARASLDPGAQISDVLDWTVANYLESRGSLDRVVLDIITHQGEASMLQAMKILLACSPHQTHLPVATVTESKLRSIFGYVTLPQILASIVVSSPQQDRLALTQVALDQGSRPDSLLDESQSLSEAAELLLAKRLPWLPVADAEGRVSGVLGVQHVVQEISKVFGTDGDLLREFKAPVREAMFPFPASHRPFVGSLSSQEFPMSLKALLRRVLLSQGSAVLVADADRRLTAVFSIEDVLGIILSLKESLA